MGDTYIGRLLCGLDPNSEDYSILSPHFQEGMEHEHTQQTLRYCFRSILIAVMQSIYS